MSEFSKVKFVKANRLAQGAKQYSVEKVTKEQKFERILEKLSLLKVTSKERKEKDVMLNKGIEYAYKDIKGKGIEGLSVDCKNHLFFVKGYEVGNRRIRIAGSDFFNSGLNLEDAPEHIKGHHEFIKGYNMAKSQMNDEEKHKYR